MDRLLDWYRDRVRRHDTGIFWVIILTGLIVVGGTAAAIIIARLNAPLV